MISPLLRARDVAKILCVSETTVRNLVAEDRLQAVRFRARPGEKGDRMTIRFRAEDLEEFIMANLSPAEGRL